jgi:hypothetical protein
MNSDGSGRGEHGCLRVPPTSAVTDGEVVFPSVQGFGGDLSGEAVVADQAVIEEGTVSSDLGEEVAAGFTVLHHDVAVVAG